MHCYICTTCGTEYPPSVQPPELCAICNEERQYVNPNGQTWTTFEQMRGSNAYSNEIIQEEQNLFSVTTKPRFAIGQTAYVVQTGSFNVLWDCITYLDDKTLAEVRRFGGLHAIALSHPHYYSAQVEWAEALDVQIFIHQDDAQWVVRPSNRIEFWSGESLALSDGLTLHRLGGHYKGGAVLHWENGNEGKGILFTGDIIQVVADSRWVSFMYSYPNLIPLPARKVAEIEGKVSLLPFDRLYNAFHHRIGDHAKESVRNSAERYIAALKGTLFDT